MPVATAPRGRHSAHLTPPHTEIAMQMSPVIAIHLAAASSALLLGPVVLWTRRGRVQRPWLHRALGYAWVTLMVLAAVSALWIRDFRLPNIGGYTPIHLLVPATFGGLALAFWRLSRRNIPGHRRAMQITYVAGCIVAGSFALLPDRYLGQLLWGQWLGLLS